MDIIVDMFMKAWEQKDYTPGEELPDWVEIEAEDLVGVLHRFANLLTETNSKPAQDIPKVE